MATVNGSKDWHSKSASPDSKIFTTAVIVSSGSMPLTFRRAMEAMKKKQEESRKTGKAEDAVNGQ